MGFKALFLVTVFACYGLTFTGHIVSGDNLVQYHQTTQILDKGRLSFSEEDVKRITANDILEVRNRFIPNRDGKSYSQMYGIGQAILAAPLFLFMRTAKLAADGLPLPQDVTLWCMNWIFYGVACAGLAMYFVYASGLHKRRLWAAAAVFSAAFASPLWMNTSLAFNVMGEMLVIFAALAVVLRIYYARKLRIPEVYFLGAALAVLLAAGYLTRPFFATSVPAFVFLFAASTWRLEGDLVSKKKALAFFAVSLAAAGVGLAAYNWFYFGSPAETAYASRVHFASPWFSGIVGTFAFPLCTPLYFFPVIALFPVAIAYLAFKREPLWIFFVLFMLPQIYFIPRYPYWDTAPDLFSRYWLRVVPLAYLAVIGAAALASGRRWNKVFLGVFIVLTLLGVRAQFLTSMTEERAVYLEAAEGIRAQIGENAELHDYREPFWTLFWNERVSRIQADMLSVERRFLFPRVPTAPMDRAGWVSALLVLSAFSLIPVFREKRS